MTLIMLTKEEILYYWDYDRENGILIWKNAPAFNKKRLIGKIAGRIGPKGYRETKLKNKIYSVYKIIWFVENDFWAKAIDHKNGNRDDNRILNLKSVNSRQNNQNRIAHRKGKLVGNTFEKSTGLWRARILINGKNKHLGRFKTELQAHKAYLKALKLYEL